MLLLGKNEEVSGCKQRIDSETLGENTECNNVITESNLQLKEYSMQELKIFNINNQYYNFMRYQTMIHTVILLGRPIEHYQGATIQGTVHMLRGYVNTYKVTVNDDIDNELYPDQSINLFPCTYRASEVEETPDLFPPLVPLILPKINSPFH